MTAPHPTDHLDNEHFRDRLGILFDLVFELRKEVADLKYRLQATEENAATFLHILSRLCTWNYPRTRLSLLQGRYLTLLREQEGKKRSVQQRRSRRKRIDEAKLRTWSEAKERKNVGTTSRRSSKKNHGQKTSELRG
jgi:hypothetical protein